MTHNPLMNSGSLRSLAYSLVLKAAILLLSLQPAQVKIISMIKKPKNPPIRPKIHQSYSFSSCLNSTNRDKSPKTSIFRSVVSVRKNSESVKELTNQGLIKTTFPSLKLGLDLILYQYFSIFGLCFIY